MPNYYNPLNFYPATYQSPVGYSGVSQPVMPAVQQPVQQQNFVSGSTVRNACNVCNPRAQYTVSYSGNIAVAEGGTVGQIQLGLSVNGFVRPLTLAAATPAAAEQYWHVSGYTTVDVPAGCCADVAVVNASTSTAGTPPTITVQNLNVNVNRVA